MKTIITIIRTFYVWVLPALCLLLLAFSMLSYISHESYVYVWSTLHPDKGVLIVVAIIMFFISMFVSRALVEIRMYEVEDEPQLVTEAEFNAAKAEMQRKIDGIVANAYFREQADLVMADNPMLQVEYDEDNVMPNYNLEDGIDPDKTVCVYTGGLMMPVISIEMQQKIVQIGGYDDAEPRARTFEQCDAYGTLNQLVELKTAIIRRQKHQG